MGNVNMEASQINYRGGSKKMSVEEAIKAAGTEITPEEKEWIDTIPELASQEIIAPEFDAEEGVYAVGDLVIYQGGLYQFTTAHETAGAWNAEEVAAVKVSDEIDSLKSGLTKKKHYMLTTNTDGNIAFVSEGDIVGIIPDRSQEDEGCYISWFTGLVGTNTDGTVYSIKFVDATLTKIENTKISFYVLYI